MDWRVRSNVEVDFRKWRANAAENAAGDSREVAHGTKKTKSMIVGNPKTRKTFLRGLRKSLRKGRYCSHLESDWNCSSDFPIQGTTCTKACTVIEGGEGVQRCHCDNNGCYWDPDLPHGCFGITSRSFTIVGTQETTVAYDHAEDEGKPHCAHSKFLEKLGKIFDKLKPDDTLAMAIVENGTMHSLGDFDETIENFYS